MSHGAGGGGTVHWNEEVLWLCRKIVFHNPTDDYVLRGSTKELALVPPSKSLFYSGGKGLPIGNLTSQFFANVYLNELDHFIVDELGAKRYVRYVDDFVIVDDDKEELKTCILKIDGFLKKNLGLELHPQKIKLQKTLNGVDFLGYFLKPYVTLVRQKVVRRYKERMYRSSSKTGLSKEEVSTLVSVTNSYFGHFMRASSHRLRGHLFSEHLGVLRRYVEKTPEYEKISTTL